MRLTLADDEVLELMKAIETSMPELHDTIKAQYDADLAKDKSIKRESMKSATIARERTAKAKIQNAINILRLEGRELTAYAIAKESGTSYNTVKKHYKETH